MVDLLTNQPADSFEVEYSVSLGLALILLLAVL